MYYSELLNSPISSHNVKRLYGVNPDTCTSYVKASLKLFPIVKPPEGYSTVGYQKVDNVYHAIASAFNKDQLNNIYAIQETGHSLEEAAIKLSQTGSGLIPDNWTQEQRRAAMLELMDEYRSHEESN